MYLIKACDLDSGETFIVGRCRTRAEAVLIIIKMRGMRQKNDPVVCGIVMER